MQQESLQTLHARLAQAQVTADTATKAFEFVKQRYEALVQEEDLLRRFRESTIAESEEYQRGAKGTRQEGRVLAIRACLNRRTLVHAIWKRRCLVAALKGEVALAEEDYCEREYMAGVNRGKRFSLPLWKSRPAAASKRIAQSSRWIEINDLLLSTGLANVRACEKTG